jgi:hypothetical protein
MFLFKTKKISNIIKRCSLIIFVFLLFINQVSALPTLITFGEKHEVSIISTNGQTFLKLEHSHEHVFHHQSTQKKNQHNHRIAHLFNGHDGKHTDHLIMISNTKENLSTSSCLSKKFSFEQYNAIPERVMLPKIEEHIRNNIELNQKNQLVKDLNFLEYSIQFLV